MFATQTRVPFIIEPFTLHSTELSCRSQMGHVVPGQLFPSSPQGLSAFKRDMNSGSVRYMDTATHMGVSKEYTVCVCVCVCVFNMDTATYMGVSKEYTVCVRVCVCLTWIQLPIWESVRSTLCVCVCVF